MTCIGCRCDEAFKATSHLSEAAEITEGKTRLPGLNIAFGFHKSPFEWMSDNAWRGERMGKAMQQLHRTTNGNVTSGKAVAIETYICVSNKYSRLSMEQTHFPRG